MPEIRLPTGAWTYYESELLGAGGFGAVYRGQPVRSVICLQH